MSIKDTRACINAILDGSIVEAKFETLPIFNLYIPKELSGVNTKVLNPINTWEEEDRYNSMLKKLASMFIENFKKYQSEDSEFDYSKAGPQL